MTTASNDSTSTSTPTPGETELPAGTSAPYERTHRIIRRVCYVLLFGLVIEGALTFPLLAIWYGFPELTPTEVCSELQKHAYGDGTRECQVPYEQFPGPPFGGPAEAEGQDTSDDDWGVQPEPRYPPIGYRELVENEEEREARENEAQGNGSP